VQDFLVNVRFVQEFFGSFVALGCTWMHDFGRTGAPPTPRFGVSEAKVQKLGRKCAAGRRRCVCVLEIVRPGMEESESAEKQENTGMDLASACGAGLRTRPTPSRAPEGVQRERRWRGARLIRDRRRLERSRVCSASSLRAAQGSTCGCTKSRLGQFP